MKRLLIIFSMCLLQFACASNKKPISHANWNQAIKKAVTRFGKPQEKQLTNYFANAKVAYPPKNIALLAFKDQRVVQLWAKNQEQRWHYIHTYPLTAYSGKLGPKLKENDYQIPEGIYEITNLNPFSSLHLSMMLNYPNAFDVSHGKQDGRKKLGNNIFIHGRNLSVGCLAIGDKAIDQLFMLVNTVGMRNTKVIISPVDFRKQKINQLPGKQPKWLPSLYAKIRNELKRFV